MSEKFWEQPIETLDRGEWEALCDGCGQCCMHKIEDADTGRIHDTNVACRLLDLETARCSDYRRRRFLVPDCIRLSRAKIASFPWLPATCAYRLRAEGKPLFDWHYLISGSAESVHEAGVSMRGRAVSESVAGPLETHVLED
ncbi:YcgN family cysteine cluster protein [Novosphingopyxis sp.]|uniref:YcgN family cysteine cluster protein n=1 Tax=Novosphingopyxis sp. TaxID=2709690 RepID=UPI003B5966C2